MLVLKRVVGERVRLKVGDVIVWITVVNLDRNGRGANVRLGLDAPREVIIHREEMLQPEQRKGGS